MCGDVKKRYDTAVVSPQPQTLPMFFSTQQVAFLEGSDVYLATALAFLRMHEMGPAYYCIGTLMAHLDLCQRGMYEVDILLHQVKLLKLNVTR